jgi:hypothetical protein
VAATAWRDSRYTKWAALVPTCSLYGTSEDVLVVPGLTGRPGGRLFFALRTEPKTLNPAIAGDNASREVLHQWSPQGALTDTQGKRVEFSIVTSSGNPGGLAAGGRK